MAFCANCGAEASGNFCAGCGAATGEAAGPPAGMVAAADVIALARIQAEAAEKNQRHGVPALLSFFIPGLGQLIKGHIASGIVIFLAMCLSVALMAAMIGFVTTPIFWIWQVYEAYKSAE